MSSSDAVNVKRSFEDMNKAFRSLQNDESLNTAMISGILTGASQAKDKANDISKFLVESSKTLQEIQARCNKIGKSGTVMQEYVRVLKNERDELDLSKGDIEEKVKEYDAKKDQLENTFKVKEQEIRAEEKKKMDELVEKLKSSGLEEKDNLVKQLSEARASAETQIAAATEKLKQEKAMLESSHKVQISQLQARVAALEKANAVHEAQVEEQRKQYESELALIAAYNEKKAEELALKRKDVMVKIKSINEKIIIAVTQAQEAADEATSFFEETMKALEIFNGEQDEKFRQELAEMRKQSAEIADATDILANETQNLNIGDIDLGLIDEEKEDTCSESGSVTKRQKFSAQIDNMIDDGASETTRVTVNSDGLEQPETNRPIRSKFSEYEKSVKNGGNMNLVMRFLASHKCDFTSSLDEALNFVEKYYESTSSKKRTVRAAKIAKLFFAKELGYSVQELEKNSVSTTWYDKLKKAISNKIKNEKAKQGSFLNIASNTKPQE